MNKNLFFAVNRHTNRACLLSGFRHWELVQGAFRCGILMPDGQSATGIGRAASLADFIARANKGETTILVSEDDNLKLEIEVRPGSIAKVSFEVWRSWTGARFIEGIKCVGERFVWLSNDVTTSKIAA